jgi:hypothetical protein
MVAQACNPSYTGGRIQEDCGLKLARAKSLRDPHLHQWLDTVTHACPPSYTGKHKKGSLYRSTQA